MPVSVDTRVLLLSISAFFSMLSFYPCMVAASKIIEDLGYNSLGFYMISVTSLSLGISSPFASVLIRRMGSRTAI